MKERIVRNYSGSFLKILLSIKIKRPYENMSQDLLIIKHILCIALVTIIM